MKCDELKAYCPYANRDGFYHKSEADKVIAEKDAAIAELKAENERLKEGKNDYKQFYQDTFKELESLKASHYAEMVDAGMRERRLRRALWLARALRARDIQRWWIAVTCSPRTEVACIRWNNIERKCRAKAEEYK